MILAYVVRHGETDRSPNPEWWSQIPLNALGEAQARDAGEFIKTEKVKPKWGVSSDLKRAEQTLAICAEVLNLTIVRPMYDLRAFGKDEDQKKFEARNERAFTAILATAKVRGEIPLIACHRSNSAWIAKRYGWVRQEVDYRQASAIWEGGVIVIDSKGAHPIYKKLSENPKEDLGQPNDGTHIAGFVTDEENKPPRECWNCKWIHSGACHHPVVTADDELGLIYSKVRNKDGFWMVGDKDCCDNFQNTISLSS